MNIVNRNRAYAASRCLAAVFLLALSGCVSAVSEKKDESAAAALEAAAVTAQAPSAEQKQIGAAQRQVPGYVDPAMVSASSARRGNVPAQMPGQAQGQGQGQSTPNAYGQAPQISGLATQPTGISANSLSIYASSQPGVQAAAPQSVAPASPDTNVPAYAPSQKIVPAFNSVYSSPVHPSAGQAMPAQGQEHSALSGSQNSPDGQQQPGVPVSAFAAGSPRRPGGAALAGATQVAALPSSVYAQRAVAGRTTMTDEFDDTDDSKPAGLMKLASLSGLSRVAPNGLLLQTGQVEVGCFKPEMIRRIKEVEAHYGKRAMVTSGYRPAKATTQGSKHYTCDAADIQVSGVSKGELASYLRSLPDRGGVGTYCHTESVHMDLGEPRDWNWRCRRTATSL